MDELLEKISSLMITSLYHQSPVLSGNMRSGINLTKVENDEVNFVIDAPFYDVKLWEKDKVIVYTGQVIFGETDYAREVNDAGAFGKRNKSMHWVNRAILEVVKAATSEYENVEIINTLPL